jgi:hypothetical protein
MKPILWYHPISGRIRFEETKGWIPLYHKEWKGLTDKQIETLMDIHDVTSKDYARAIEFMLKGMNHE